MKELLKKLIVDDIGKWQDQDIYAISLFVHDECDNPCKPTVTLGYNTESQVETEKTRAYNECEARWNYAFWLQNSFFVFGTGDTANVVRQWLDDNDLPFYDDDDEWDDDAFDDTAGITEKFIDFLVEIVKEIHADGVLTKKFGKEIPILIHELEYYDEIANQNIEANGECLDEEFVRFCKWDFNSEC